MTPERWRQVTEVFHAALALDAPAREAYLDQACAGDSALREEVAAMLAAHRHPRRLGESPVIGAIDGAPARPGRGVGGVPYRAADRLGRDGGGLPRPRHEARTRRRHQGAPRGVHRRRRPPGPLRAGSSPAGRAEPSAHRHIYGVEMTGIRALVMEMVEGPTLADRIARPDSPSMKHWPSPSRSPKR